MKGVKVNGVGVSVNFIFRRIMPCKERAHPAYDFKGETNFTRERPKILDKDEVLICAATLFALGSAYHILDQARAYSCARPPPPVRICAEVGVRLYVSDALY